MTSETIEYFLSIPQCAAIINRPGVTISPGQSDAPKASSHRNPLFNETLTLNNGLKRQLILFRDEVDATGAPDQETYALMELGEGVMGQPGISHGGFLSAVLDHITGTMVKLAGADKGLGMFTVALNLSYHKPVFVPGVIITTARISKVERRRIHLEAAIRDMQGDVCTTAEVIFVQKRPQL